MQFLSLYGLTRKFEKELFRHRCNVRFLKIIRDCDPEDYVGLAFPWADTLDGIDFWSRVNVMFISSLESRAHLYNIK